MSSILDTIIAAKRKEVEKGKKLRSVNDFEKKGPFWNVPARSLRKQLEVKGSPGIIAEFKRRSPSKGWFVEAGTELWPVVTSYEKNGASAISVLTDEEFFGGRLEDLTHAREITKVPLLRKDFIIDAWQIAEAKAAGADVILLIAACLTPPEVRSLASYANNIGLEVLLELHDEEELGHICEDTILIGVNNRDLKTFKVDIERSLRMAEQIQQDKIKIAESGISSSADILQFREHGFKGFLMGEHFMKATDPGAAFRDFMKELEKIQYS